MLLRNYISDFRDEIRVNPLEDYAVNYWSEKLNVSPSEILKAIQDTGSDKLNAIVRFLKKEWTPVF
jgi:hypothetical protein